MNSRKIPVGSGKNFDLSAFLLYLWSVVFVITGPVHSGKTSFLQKTVIQLKNQKVRLDGYLSLAVVRGKERLGYDFLDLRTEEAIPFLRRTGEKGWPVIGPYFLDPRVLQKAKEKILGSSPQDLLVVDEIGPLEVRGEGIWPALSVVLKEPSRCFVLVVRRAILEQVAKLLSEEPAAVIDLTAAWHSSDLLDLLAGVVRKLE